MPVRVNVSAVIGEPLLGVSPPLYVALLLVVAPLEVSPPLEEETLTRSRGLSVVQVWVRLGLGFNQGGSTSKGATTNSGATSKGGDTPENGSPSPAETFTPTDGPTQSNRR